MSRARSLSILLSVLLATGICPGPVASGAPPAAQASSNPPTAYLGFDRNVYPGDEALAMLRRTFAFTGYWLSPPPGEKFNSWRGKRRLLQSHGFGFALLYLGPENKELKTETVATRRGVRDAQDAASLAKTQGFAELATIFLDIEEGGRLSAAYHAYLRAWTDELARRNYRAGVYCSGMIATESGGVTIITADDIRRNIGPRELAYWVFNDACPPSPGCVSASHPSLPSASGVPDAAVWQFAQSPRRIQFTTHCASTYQNDGNCYAPEVATYFLDMDTATSPNPSGSTHQ